MHTALVGLLTCTLPLHKPSHFNPILSIGLHAVRVFTILHIPRLESKINTALDIFTNRNFLSIALSYGVVSLGILAPLDEIQFSDSKGKATRILKIAFSYTAEALLFHFIFSNLEHLIHPSLRNYYSWKYISAHFISLLGSCWIQQNNFRTFSLNLLSKCLSDLLKISFFFF